MHPAPLNRDRFMTSVIGRLAEALQSSVGLQVSSGLISLVALQTGRDILTMYRHDRGRRAANAEEVAESLVDLKARIGGDFRVEEANATSITLSNRRCPFGDDVLGRPALCMMTSNVFGTIAANELGYARVDVQRSIAEGHGHCRVVVDLVPKPASEIEPGREYYRGE